MEKRLARALNLFERAFVAGQLALILLFAGTAVLYAHVYVGNWADDIAYHIPGAVRIAKNLNPYFVDSSVDSHWYPAGAETFAALFVWAIGSLYAANVTGALCFIAICLGTFLASGLWSRSLEVRLTSTLAVAAIPVMLGQCAAFYVDIHFALLVAASLWLQAAALVRRQPQLAWLGLAAALLAPSVKYAGLFTLIVLVPGCVLAIRLLSPPRRPRWSVALALVASLAFSSGFYLRNWCLRGNPLFPIELPTWLRPVAALSPAPYESDPEFFRAVRESPMSAVFPRPWLPSSFTWTGLKPDMIDDAFGAVGTILLLASIATLASLRRLDRDRRGAWLLVLVETVALLLLFPLPAQNPRYVLFVPIALALSPAVLAAALPSGRGRDLVDVVCAAVLVFAGIFAWCNLIDAGRWTSLQAVGRLVFAPPPRPPEWIAWAQAGHLRIGYTSGHGNSISLLYDPGLTNELVSLHYRDFFLNHGPDFATPEEFVAHVCSLNLDGIQIWDDADPAAALLLEHFPEKVHVDPLWRGAPAKEE